MKVVLHSVKIEEIYSRRITFSQTFREINTNNTKFHCASISRIFFFFGESKIPKISHCVLVTTTALTTWLFLNVRDFDQLTEPDLGFGKEENLMEVSRNECNNYLENFYFSR